MKKSKSWKKIYKKLEKAIRYKKKKVKKLKKSVIEKRLRARIKELEGAKQRKNTNILARRRGFYK